MSTGVEVTRALLIAAGLIGIGVGVVELVNALPTLPDQVSFGAWFLGPPIVSDLVLMPAVAVLGYLVSRLPSRIRTWVAASGIVTLALIAVAAPFLGAPGRRADNPTLLDRDYSSGLAIAVAVVWLVIGGGLLLARRRSSAKMVRPVDEKGDQ